MWTSNGDFRTTGLLLGTPTALAGCVSLSNQHCFLILDFSGIFLTRSSHRQGLTVLTSHFNVPGAHSAIPSYCSPSPICKIRDPCLSCLGKTLQLEKCTGPWPLFIGLGAKSCFYICKGLFRKSKTKHVTPVLNPKKWPKGGCGRDFLTRMFLLCSPSFPRVLKKEI